MTHLVRFAEMVSTGFTFIWTYGQIRWGPQAPGKLSAISITASRLPWKGNTAHSAAAV